MWRCFPRRVEPGVPHASAAPPSFGASLERYIAVETAGSQSSLRQLLEGEDVVLIRGSYFLELKRTGGILPRRQDLPAHAIVDRKMMLRLLAELRSVADSKFGFNMQFPGIVVVSYAWAAAEHPDGKGNMIREVLAPAIEWYMSERAALIRDQEFWAAELDAETTELEAVDFALFLDFSSLYQKPRDEAQDESFKRALADMELLYGHQLTVKWRLTRSLSDAQGLPYSERGWPFFETCVSHLISLAPHVLDLGRVDWTRPISYPVHKWNGRENAVIKHEVASFSGEAKPFDVLADQGLYVNAGTPMLVGEVQDRRQPPITPLDFSAKEAVHAKKFTNDADVQVVIDLHEAVALAVLGGVQDLLLNHQGWDAADGAALAIALRHTQRVRMLDLGFNQLGDGGVRPIADAAAAGCLPHLATLKLHANGIGDSGATALAGAVAAGSLRQLGTLLLHINSVADKGAVALAGALKQQRTPCLEHFTLSKNGIGASGLAALAAAIPALPSLRQLRLEGNPVDARGAAPIAAACKKRAAKVPFVVLQLPQAASTHTVANDPGVDRGTPFGGPGGRRAYKRRLSVAGPISSLSFSLRRPMLGGDEESVAEMRSRPMRQHSARLGDDDDDDDDTLRPPPPMPLMRRQMSEMSAMSNDDDEDEALRPPSPMPLMRQVSEMLGGVGMPPEPVVQLRNVNDELEPPMALQRQGSDASVDESLGLLGKMSMGAQSRKIGRRRPEDWMNGLGEAGLEG